MVARMGAPSQEDAQLVEAVLLPYLQEGQLGAGGRLAGHTPAAGGRAGGRAGGHVAGWRVAQSFVGLWRSMLSGLLVLVGQMGLCLPASCVHLRRFTASQRLPYDRIPCTLYQFMQRHCSVARTLASHRRWRTWV